MATADLAPAFSDTYPEILAPWVSEREFRALVIAVNDACIRAFMPSGARAWIDAFMGVATGWLWEDFGFAQGKSGAKEVENVVERWNREVHRKRESDGLLGGKENVGEEMIGCISLRRTAYMSLDFVIPDPKIAVVEENLREGSIASARGENPRTGTVKSPPKIARTAK